jgi:ammonium transporter, Amt family
MNLKPFWAGMLPALALCGALLCTTIVSAQEATETKQEEPAAAKTEVPKTETPKAEAKPEEAKPETAAAATEEKKEETIATAAPADARPSVDELTYAIDNITLFICAVLVIFMQAGFALVETGLNSSKNAVNIMF